MKKKLLSILLVLLMVTAMIPAAHAEFGGEVWLTEGEYAEEDLCWIPNQEYTAEGGPAGMYLRDDPGAGMKGISLYGTPYSAGTYYMTLYLEDGSTREFTIHVDAAPAPELVGININTWPNKQSYEVGDSLNTDGLSINLIFSDGSQSQAWSGFSCSPTYFSNAGNQEVWVNYNGFSAYFTVSVASKPKVLQSISVFRNPSKTTYTVGDNMDPTGLVLQASYSDGSVDYPDYTWGSVSYYPTNFRTPGIQPVSVYYGDKATSFSVTVKNPRVLTGISLNSSPLKTVYNINSSLDPTGLVLRANYNDGTYELIYSGFACSPTTFTKEGPQQVTVTYAGNSCTFNVTVQDPNKPTGISIASMPTKTSYKLGEQLDISGLKINVKTESGVKTIDGKDAKVSVNPTNLATAGQQIITVTYNDGKNKFDCQFPVTVEAPAQPTASPLVSPVLPSPTADPAEDTPAKTSGTNAVLVVLLIVAVLAVIALAGVVIASKKKSKKK